MVHQNQHPESTKEIPDVSIAIGGGGSLTPNNKNAIIPFDENEFWLSNGPLGICNNTYCMTCPTYSHGKNKDMLEICRIYQTKQAAYQKLQDGQPNNWTTKFLLFMHKSTPGSVNPHSKFVQQWERIFLFSCLLATFVDPLFLFLLSVQRENHCIVFDWRMAWIIVGLRSISDLHYLFHMLLQFRLAYIMPEHRVVGLGVLVAHPKEIVCNYLKRFFWIDIVVVLPLPQVVTMLVRRNHLLNANDTKNVLCLVVIFQLLPRLYRFLPMLAGRSTIHAFIFETAWANFIINILNFLLAGHMIGSCWYILGLQRVSRCLKDACHTSGMIWSNCTKLIDCGHVSNNTGYTLLKTPDEWRNNSRAISCFTEDGFGYGIYLKAVNLTTEHNVIVRYINSLFWGFHQISTLAGNQSPSYYVWEVLFTMLIVGIGLLLFALLVGNIQNFLQALGRRRMEMMLRRRDVDQWMSHRRLPDNMRKRVRHAEEYKWKATRGVDEEKLMINLPEDLQKGIRRHLFEFLYKVPILSAMGDVVIDSLSERLRQKTYITGCQIIFRGGPIKKMTFIVRGEMESVGEYGHVSHLSAGDVCGDELLVWCLEDSSGNSETKPRGTTGERPISERTVTCLTNVETFVLGAADLQEVTSLFAYVLQNPKAQEAIRFEMGSRAARKIQAAWRKMKMRIKLSNTAGVSKSLIPFQKDHLRM